jgi:trk system potassium uptake protein
VHVVVVGCGRVGSGLAMAVEAAGHTAAIVDRREAAFSRLAPDFTGRKVVGVGFDRDRLRAAGIEEAGAVAAVTNGDNSNILIARVARETFDIDRVVARIYDPRRAAIYERLGIPTVATVQWATERVLRRMLPESPAVEWIDPSAKVCLLERSAPPAWVGRKLEELEIPGEARVVSLSRLGAAQIARLELVVQEGDVLHVAVAGDRVSAFEAHLSNGSEGKH